MRNLWVPIITSFVLTCGFTVAYAVDNKLDGSYAACADREEGDACEFTNAQGETVNGACHRASGGDGKMTCNQYKTGS